MLAIVSPDVTTCVCERVVDVRVADVDVSVAVPVLEPVVVRRVAVAPDDDTSSGVKLLPGPGAAKLFCGAAPFLAAADCKLAA